MVESACSVGDLDLISGWGRSLEKEMATHSSIFACKNLTDRGGCQAIVHGVAESDTTERLHCFLLCALKNRNLFFIRSEVWDVQEQGDNQLSG